MQKFLFIFLIPLIVLGAGRPQKIDTIQTSTESFLTLDAPTTVTGKLTLQDEIETQGVVTSNIVTDSTSTGSNIELLTPTTEILRFTNAGLVSIDMIVAPTGAQKIILINHTGVEVVLNNATGATAANQMLTGTSDSLTLEDQASVNLTYDTIESKWMVVGGSGSGGSPTTTLGDMIVYGTFGDERLPVGIAGSILTSVGGEPQWDISPITISVKGDLQGHDASDPVTIPVGANNTHLVADSAEASGVRWSDTISGSIDNDTDWISFTPTISNTTGVKTGRYRQDGDTIFMQSEVVLNASPGGQIIFDLPAGLTIDTAKMAWGAGSVSQVEGEGKLYDLSTNDGFISWVYSTDDVNSFSLYGPNGQGAWGVGTPITSASGDTIKIDISVPIVGWTSGTTAIVTNQVLGMVRARQILSQTFTDASFEAVEFDDEQEDNQNLFDAPNGIFTCPAAGKKYRISFSTLLNDMNAGSDRTFLQWYSTSEAYNFADNQQPITPTTTAVFNKSMDISGHIFKCDSASQEWYVGLHCNQAGGSACNSRASASPLYYTMISIDEIAPTINNVTPLGPSTGLQLGDCKWSLLSTVDFENLHGTGWVQMEGQSIAGSDIDNTYSISALPNQVANSGFIRQQGSGSAALRTYQVDATAKNGLTATSANDSHNHLLTRNVDEAANLLSGSESIAYRGNVGDARYVLMGSASTANTGASSSDTHNHTITVGAGDSETRPNNVALNMYCKIND